MNREEKNIGSIILFIVIVLAIGFGGYYLISNKTSSQNKSNDYKSGTEIKKIKIDDSKNYVYFTNEYMLDNHEDLVYKDIIININSTDAKNLQEKLNKEMASIKVNSIPDDEKIEMIEYNVVETSKYLSLTVNKYFFEDNEATNSSLDYYVFDLSSGNILANRDIMKNENVTDQEIRSKIRSYINNDADVDIDATLSKEYKLSISKTGKIIINTVVKTSELDYNVSIEMD
ncbi:MAG: hypothetical protein IJ572_05555 [Bacilli bacterium]|nr:hypothetical protein [Bacilli bacterium]